MIIYSDKFLPIANNINNNKNYIQYELIETSKEKEYYSKNIPRNNRKGQSDRIYRKNGEKS